jgi:hypothetical protein
LFVHLIEDPRLASDIEVQVKRGVVRCMQRPVGMSEALVVPFVPPTWFVGVLIEAGLARQAG